MNADAFTARRREIIDHFFGVFIGVSCNLTGKQQCGIYEVIERRFQKGILRGHSLHYHLHMLQDKLSHSSSINTECDALRILALSSGLDHNSKASATGTKANLSKETSMFTPYKCVC